MVECSVSAGKRPAPCWLKMDICRDISVNGKKIGFFHLVGDDGMEARITMPNGERVVFTGYKTTAVLEALSSVSGKYKKASEALNDNGVLFESAAKTYLRHAERELNFMHQNGLTKPKHEDAHALVKEAVVVLRRNE